MKIEIYPSHEELSINAARLIAAQVRLRPASVLGLATGSSPLRVYEELIRMHQEENLDFSEVCTINLDEYVGLAADNINSYSYYMQSKLFRHINIDTEWCFVPYSLASDPYEEAERYEELSLSLDVDIQLLGIGQNAHIGFNEPADSFIVPAHVVTLSESTIEANKRFFDKKEDVPRQAITVGIGQIMRAKKILLIASGTAKAEAIKNMLNGKVDPHVPASILQVHPDVTLMLDDAAASLLPLGEGA